MNDKSAESGGNLTARDVSLTKQESSRTTHKDDVEKKRKKIIIISVCVAAAVVLIIVVAIIVALMGKDSVLVPGVDSNIIEYNRIVMGSNQNVVFDIAISIESGSDSLSGSGSQLFKMEAYMTNTDSSESSEKIPVIVQDQSITVSSSHSPVTLSDVTVTINLNDMNCDVWGTLCVDISPKAGAGWSWESVDMVTVCELVDDCQNQITPKTIAFSGEDSSNIRVLFGAFNSLVLDITVETDYGTAEISGNANSLMKIQIFLSSNEHGSQSVAANRITVAQDTILISPEQEFVIQHAVIDRWDLNDMSCQDTPFLCVSISPSEGAGWSWNSGTDAFTGCHMIEVCTSQVTGTVHITQSDAIKMGLSLPIGVTISLDLERGTAKLSGDVNSIFNFAVRLATDQTGNLPYTEVAATAVPSSNIDICADCTVNGLDIRTAEYNLNDVGCHQYQYICVTLSPTSHFPWHWDDQARGTSCATFDCTAVIDPDLATSTYDFPSLAIIMGVSHTYRFGNITLHTGNTHTARLAGNLHELFQIIFHILENENPTETTYGEAIFDDVLVDLAAEGTVTFTNVEVNIDLSLFLCEELDYLCYMILPRLNSSWIWYEDAYESEHSHCIANVPCRDTYVYSTVTTEQVDWATAAAACSDEGMHLPVFASLYEAEHLRYILWRSGIIDAVWFGANDRITEGDWVYEDGSPVVDYGWSPGEPNNAIPEDDCGLVTMSMTWNDVDCSFLNYQVCQIKGMCTPDFTCDNGKCIPAHMECDFYDDCGDGTDETHCECHSDFLCGEGICIEADKFCDGPVDCVSGADEADCNYIPLTDCYPDFQCGLGECVGRDWRCDTFDDCPDGEDEQGCPCDGFRCLDSKACVPLLWICDGRGDCTDESDEQNCAEICPGVLCDSGECIPDTWLCDTYDDCTDGSDEINCNCKFISTLSYI